MKIIIPIILFLFSLTLSAQEFNYFGTVVNSDGTPMENVSVTFLKENKSMMQFTFTDDKGTFVMKMTNKPMFIFFSHLGYQSRLISIDQFENNKKWHMQSSDIKLKEVNIKSNRLREKNDTLSYTVAGYRMPQDKSIADVIKKMPGIEVTNSGTIKFQDKNISKLYIDGMDLMGEKYAMITNNLSGKKVKSVQVLKNHQQITALRGKSFTEQAAINLVLEDNAKAVFSETVDFGGGVNRDRSKLWDMRTLGMLFCTNKQNMTMYKTNNVGDRVSDELIRHTFDPEMYISSLPSLLNIPKRDIEGIDNKHYLDNKDHLAVTNYLRKINENTQAKIQFSYLKSDNYIREKKTSRYYYSDKVITYEEQSDASLLNEKVECEAEYEWNSKKGYFKNIASGIWNRDISERKLSLGGKLVQDNVNYTRRQFTDRMKFVIPVGKNIFKFNSINVYEEVPANLSVIPGIFPQILNMDKDYEVFRQNVTSKNVYTHNTADWKFKLFGMYVGSKFGADFTRQEINAHIDGLSITTPNKFVGDVRFDDFDLYVMPGLSFQRSGVKIRLNIPISYHNYKLDKKYAIERFHKVFIEPKFFMPMEINPFWELTPSTSYKYYIPNINSLYPQYIFHNYREAVRGSSFYTYGNWFSNLVLKYNNPLTGTFWSLTGSSTFSHHNKILRTKYDGMLRSSSMEHYKHNTHTWSVRSRFSKSLAFWKSFLGLTTIYIANSNKLMLVDEIMPFHVKTVIFDGNYALQPSPYFNIEGRETFSITNMSSNITDGVRVKRFVNNLDVNIIPLSKFRIKWNNSWYLNYIPERTSAYFMNLSINYTHKFLGIEFLVRNMLNKSVYSRPLKTIFQCEVCKSELHSEFFYKPQKNSHSSFEVICRRS